MICKHCGAQNDDNATFCAECGNNFELAVASEVEIPTTVTPEPVSFEQTSFSSMESAPSYSPQAEYAGFWIRFLAYVIDRLVVGVPLGIIFSIFGIGFSTAAESAQTEDEIVAIVLGFLGTYIFLLFVALIINWLYSSLMESSKSQATLGKMAVGIKVTDLDGNRISFGRATGRFVSHFVTNLTFTIGYIIAAFTEKRQALHDMIAGTLVIKK